MKRNRKHGFLSHRSYDEKFGKGGRFFGSRRKKPALRVDRLPRVLLYMLCASVGILLLLAASTLWRVTEVTAEDGNFYSAAVVKEYAALEVGEDMMGFDAAAVAARLKAGLPLMENIRVIKHLSGKVSITFTEITEVYYTCHNANYYMISADDEREVLGVFPNANESRRVGAVYVGLPEAARVRVGEPLSFIVLPYEPDSAPQNQVDYEPETDEPEREYAYVTEFMDALMSSPLADRVTGMELADRYDIWFVLDRRIKVRIGDMDELDRKLILVERSLTDREMSEGTDETLPLLVDVSDPARTIHRVSPDIDLPAWAKGLA